MIRKSKASNRDVATALVAVVVLAIASACGGSSGSKTTTGDAAPTKPTGVVLLSRSSEAATQATSFSASFHADVQTGATTITEDGRMQFEAPSSMDMTISVSGQQTEMLEHGADMFIAGPGGTWYSVGDATINRSAYEQYAKSRGPVDYAGLVKQMAQASDLGDDVIDGKTYRHYDGTVDYRKAIDSIPSDVFKPGVTDIAKSVLQPMKLETWIDPDTNLPRRVVVDMTMSLPGTPATKMHMTMDYTAWNQPVSIPAAPTDAHPFSELTGGLGFDDVAYITQFAQIGVSLEAHGNALGNLPDSGLSDEQRAAVQDGLQGIRDDLSAIVALTPTARFAGSHEKFVDAQKTCDDAFGEAIRQLDAGADELDPSLEGAFEECDAELSAASDAYSSEVPAPKQ